MGVALAQRAWLGDAAAFTMRRALVFWLLAVPAAVGAIADFSTLETLPIQEGGRRKPFLVFAEESTQALTGGKRIEIEGERTGAMAWITRLWMEPAGAASWPVILVNHRPLKSACGLDVARKRFSYNELAGNAALRERLAEAAALRARPGNQRLTGLPKEASDVGMRLAEFEALTTGAAFRVLPNPTSSEGAWSVLSADRLAPLREAWRNGDQAAFDHAARELAASLAADHPAFQPPPWKMRLEAAYQRAHPFRWAWIFYLTAGFALLAAGKTRAGYAAGWTLAGVGFLAQIAGFTARILIGGRPPVTNMYESVIWVAFGAILFAMIFEAIHRSRIFLAAAIPVAVVSLILADTQPAALNSSINPLMPVLRDNFWLTTHVLTITLSYAAFALALAIAHVTLGLVILGRKPSPGLYNALYRVLQVGVLFIAVGTILGGVWANYSWGRFWDWDPKEVWALVTLLAYLFVLHGRIAGKWAGFGMSVGAILCFLSVLMAWYGVNFVLGAGLHSYGFGSGGFEYAVIFVALEIVFTGAAILRNAQLRKASSAEA